MLGHFNWYSTDVLFVWVNLACIGLYEMIQGHQPRGYIKKKMKLISQIVPLVLLHAKPIVITGISKGQYPHHPIQPRNVSS